MTVIVNHNSHAHSQFQLVASYEFRQSKLRRNKLVSMSKARMPFKNSLNDEFGRIVKSTNKRTSSTKTTYEKLSRVKKRKNTEIIMPFVLDIVK